MDLIAFLLALVGQPATTPQPAADPVQTDGGGIPTTPGPHQ